MLTIILTLAFFSALWFTLATLSLFNAEERPRLQPLDQQSSLLTKVKKNKSFRLLKYLALFNRPLCVGPLGRRISRDLSIAKVDISPEEFLLIKEIVIGLILFSTFPLIKSDMLFFWFAMSFAVGYLMPEFWIKGKVKKVKNEIIKNLPDTIDLLSLCVNAGLDFMLALKWVIEKSKPSALIEELNLVLQEISVGKARRVALADMSKRYDLSDLSTFARALIQADRMGTSVAEALNILSEDMRLTRFRRGERIALKAPLTMLIPLLLFIFPVVAILIAAPVFLDFMQNNPMSQIGGPIPGADAPPPGPPAL